MTDTLMKLTFRRCAWCRKRHGTRPCPELLALRSDYAVDLLRLGQRATILRSLGIDPNDLMNAAQAMIHAGFTIDDMHRFAAQPTNTEENA